ncbi:MAG TPA: ATP-binding protein [Longimicrobiaceae bacterium]|nr:ATP-binding protein [Longimicrobiaceae bacterium]
MRLPAAQRLFLSYLALIAALVLSLSLAADSLLRQNLGRILEADLRRELLLGAALYDSSPTGSPDSIADLLGSLSGRRVTIIRADGAVIGESERTPAQLPGIASHANRPEFRAAMAGEEVAVERVSRTVGAEHLYIATRSERGDVVRFAVPLSEVDATLSVVQRGIATVGLGALVLAAIFSFAFSVAITRPLRRIGASARAMARGDLSSRLRETRNDELGDFANALDTLGDELRRRIGQLEGERVEMQALIDSMAEGVLALSPDGRLRRANPAAARIFSLPESSRGLAPEAIARRPDFLALVRRALGGDSIPPTELVDGERHLLATGQPLPDGGTVLVFLDVSELRRLEGVRRDFVANASHELKTPLTAIRGYSETLLDPEMAPETARRFAGILHANADRLQRIVDDLLDLSRLESGHWRIDATMVDLRDAVEEAWAPFAGAAEGRGVRFKIEVDERCASAFADPAALRQILVNLLSNALRHTPDGGAISVGCRASDVSMSERAISVLVSDTGAGITTQHLPRIFERFYRADPARSRAEGGTGLGLAIVKHLTEAHGGSVHALSRVGEGTTIVFTLPMPRDRTVTPP